MNKFLSRFSLLLLASFFSVSASAQMNLAGYWNGNFFEDQPDRGAGPEIGDYGGLPINAADRLRAQSWSASLIALPEYQCRVHPADYANSFANIRIREEYDEQTEALIAVHLQHFAWQTRRVIWMDGREHPPEYAQHTSMGFSTGEWNGHILTVKTTHLKEGWLRRNGVARSDMATMTEHFSRHDDFLTWTTIVDDPIYFDEPFVRNRDYELSSNGLLGSYPCEPVVEMVRAPTYVPHYLPGENPVLQRYSITHDIPFEAAMGGAETMYPEYRETVRNMTKPSELND
jgi:hypothetical protein